MISNLSGVRLPVIGGAAAAAMLLAACSSSPAAPATGSGAKGVAAHATASADVPQYVAADNARKSVTTGTCKMDGKKGWVFSGRVKNTSKTAHRYSIVVDFVTAKGDTVMDTKIVHTASIKSGASASWKTMGAAGHAGISCVVREALDKS
jgi:hypothetical protein